MKSMNGHKYYIIILICKLDDFMHPASVILHPYKSTEYTHTVINVNYIIPYRKGSKIIDCKLFTLFYSPSYAYPMETVKNLMVGITAYLIFVIN